MGVHVSAQKLLNPRALKKHMKLTTVKNTFISFLITVVLLLTFQCYFIPLQKFIGPKKVFSQQDPNKNENTYADSGLFDEDDEDPKNEISKDVFSEFFILTFSTLFSNSILSNSFCYRDITPEYLSQPIYLAIGILRL